MAKFNVGDEVIYNERLDSIGTIYRIDSVYYLLEHISQGCLR